MEARVKHICKCEGVELADGSLETLGRISRGDLRRAITSLQSAFALQGNPVTSATLLDVAGEVWPPLSGSFAQPLNA
jgi:replication factor C subunit 2/4